MTAENKSPAYRAAMNTVAQMQPTATDMLQYDSRGKALVLLPPQQPVPAAEALEPLAATVLTVAEDADLQVSGYLGAFKIHHAGSELPPYDLIIDYHSPTLLQRRQPRLHTLPLGYFSAAANPDALAAARDMVGTFTKPRYFDYQPEVCAHGAAGIKGCRRCLDACPAQAIHSAGEKITVDPYLCQGCGGCVMTCPSGALRYAYPPAKDILDTLRAALAAYARESSEAPIILFYAVDKAAAINAAALPTHILPIAVEEVGVAGLEIWFATLAYGAAQVAVYADNSEILMLANEQLNIAHTLLAALQLPPAVSVVADAAGLKTLAATAPTAALTVPAQFAAGGDKRQAFFMALDYFIEQTSAADELIPLPPQAPFGEIQVDSERCTLCMACAGACPVSAVRAGNTAPRLTFIEENCVQCGLCAETCPEDAITLTPRLNTDKSARRQARLLNEDQPLHCLRCHKPFASTRIVTAIEEKLKTHSMFQQEDALRRLRLCEDCRVIDMFEGER